jgi:hypothetical protein
VKGASMTVTNGTVPKTLIITSLFGIFGSHRRALRLRGRARHWIGATDFLQDLRDCKRSSSPFFHR